YLEPLLGGAPVTGGEDDGVEGVAPAVGELDVAAADALDAGRHDADLPGPDLGEGADVEHRVRRRGHLHGERPDGRPPEPVPRGVAAEHDGAHEQHNLVHRPRRQVPLQRHPHAPDLPAHQVHL
ncbi:Os01g0274201, partial [Oryza sativa Japonica Group]